MKIEPSILGRHLHDAAVEQLGSVLRQEAYTIEVEPSGRRAGQYQPDLIARRGEEMTVYEVKVLGSRSQGNLARASRFAREHNARFKLVLVRPQRETGIEVEAAPSLLLQALRKSDRTLLLKVGSDVNVEQVDDVDFDTVLLRGDDIELKGTAVAMAGRRSGRENMAEQLALPFRFTLLLDSTQHFKGESKIEWDTSDWDDLVVDA